MYRRTQCIVVVCLVLLLASCSSPQFSPLHEDSVILAFGDSLTEGVGVDRSASYPAVLEELTGLRVVNAGISGEKTKEGLGRFAKELRLHEPDLVILLEGGNDILRNVSPAETKSNLENMINIARNQGVEILFVGVPEKSLFSSTAVFYEELAEAYGLVFEDALIAELLRNPTMKSDSVHFNELGYQTLAEGLYEILLDSGAIQ